MRPAPTFTLGPTAASADDLAQWGEVSTLALAVAAGDGEPVVAPAPYAVDWAAWAESAGATGGAGNAVVVAVPPLPAWAGLPQRLIFLGVGAGSARDARRAGAALAKATTGQSHAVALLDDQLTGQLAAFVEGVKLGAYAPPGVFSTDGQPAPLNALMVCTGDIGAQAGIDDGVVAAETTVIARRLAATPSNTKNPQWMADQANELASGTGLKVTVRDEKWLAQHGFGGVLAVGTGSATPPRLVVVEHSGANPHAAPIVMVGKGITYDTGGISLKPRESMVPMKTDMAGAAAVLGAVVGAARAGITARVIAVLSLAENALGGAAYRPGDVVTMVDGTTVEIGNTDAEGRMVLADAMAWARTEYTPATLIDMATLTGAASLGLGKHHAALYATDDALRTGLEMAAERAGEQVWAMPLVDDYRFALDSTVADLSHISTDEHISGGSITAALFLQHFAGDTPWVHLDIAGTARATKAQHEVSEGATGFGARLLLRWLQDLGAGC